MTMKHTAVKKLSFSVAALLLLGGVLPMCDLQISTQSGSTFADQVKAVVSRDDYSGIQLQKETFSQETCVLLNDSTESQDDLSEEESVEQLKNLGYTVYEEEESYRVYSPYYLKRLIVDGDVSETYGASNVIDGYLNYHIFCYETEEQTKLAYESLSRSQANVTIDSVIFAADATSDTSTATQVASSNSFTYSSYRSWGAQAMSIEPYRQYLASTATTEDVAVVVLDTGINTSHEVFEDRFFYDESSQIVGYSFYDTAYTYSGYSFEDDNGHGTHVAGIVCDLTPSNVKIIPVRVIASNGEGAMSTVLAGLSMVESTYSAQYNVTCVNLSLESDYDEKVSGNLSDYNDFTDMFSTLRKKNIACVVSAGNSSKNTSKFLPARCENAIVVSALKQTSSGYEFDKQYSNYGNEIDFSAPGTLVYSSYIASTNEAAPSVYYQSSGTSMAAPHVSAAIALLCLDSYGWRNGSPSYSIDEIEAELRSYSIVPDGSEWNKYYGYGMVSLKNFEAKEAIQVVYTLTDQVGTYGTLSLDQTAYTASVLEGVDASNVVLSLQTAATETSRVGEYELTATVVSNPDNLVIEIENATYTVQARHLILSLSKQYAVYGEEISFDNLAYEVLEGEIVQGDDLNLLMTTTAQVGSPIGDYGITLSNGSGNINYSIQYYIGTLTITPKEISATVSDQSMTYGDVFSFDETQYTLLDSILEGDELNLVLSTTATEGSDAGSYPITLSFSNENYTLRYTSANFTVLPKPITVQLLDQSVEWTVAGIEISQTAYQILEDGYEDVQIDGIVITTLKSSYKLGESYVLYGSYQGVNYDIRFYTGTLSLFEVEEAETEPSEETPEEDTKNGIDETPDDQETGKEQEETVDYAPQTEQTIEVTELLGGCMSRFESSVAVLPFLLLVLFALKKKDRK